MPERIPPESWEARTRRVRDIACVVPFVATLLFLPPVILVFSAPVTLAGIPLIVVYLYIAWAALIFATFLVARHLDRDEADQQDGRGG